jgi:transcriptional regulator with XRE-family HTH domain
MHTNCGVSALPYPEDPILDGIIRDLAKRRVELGLTQLALDDRIGLTQGHVAKWESRARRPTGFMLSCWASALRCGISIVPQD